jgi:hypothetical protein
VTVLAGEVQQWRDGKWRTILTVAGYPVTDRRPGYVREQQEGVLFEQMTVHRPPGRNQAWPPPRPQT